MSIEEHKRIILEMNEHEDYVLPQYLTDDFTFLINADPRSAAHDSAGIPLSAEQLITGWNMLKTMIRRVDGKGDGQYREIRSMIAEDDRVVVEGVARGALKADPSREITNRVVNVYTFRDNKISGIRVYEDTAFVKAFFKDVNSDLVEASLSPDKG